MYVRVSFRHRWGHDLKFVQNEEWTPQFSIAMWSVPRHFLCWVQHGEFSASSEQVHLGKYVASFNWYQKKTNTQAVLQCKNLVKPDEGKQKGFVEKNDGRGAGRNASQTIFLMLGRLKLPALRCFCTWLADPCRIRPLVERLEVGEISTFSLSIPAGERCYVTTLRAHR